MFDIVTRAQAVLRSLGEALAVVQEAYLKRITTKNGPLTSRKAAGYAWIKAWEDLE